MTLLSTVRRVNVLVGLRSPTVAADAPDATSSAQMAELARVSAEELSTRVDWSALKKTHRFTTVANIAQPGALPDDFARFTFKGGIYGGWGRIDGPIEDDRWNEWLSYPNVGGATVGSFRVTGDGVEIFPKPPAGQVMRFDYITTNLYRDVDQNPKSTWDVDTDVCRIPETIIALDTLWRWLHAKGLDYAEDMKTAEAAILKAAGNDGGGRGVLKIGRPRTSAGVFAFPGIIVKS